MGQNTRDSVEVLRADYKYTPRVVSSCYPVKCQHLSESCNEDSSKIFGLQSIGEKARLLSTAC